ncbi:MAG: hypothetical protein IJF27_03335 [Oscillospiraceae bacterium]|nr:hypothetical protein [Oscillospiraceae bacterium]MBQ3050136.1 hypothetical protein [Oscillospiraceae bacterium]
MKKNFKFYIIIWILLLAAFNVIAFVSVGWAGQEKYTASFWIGYAFISAAFVVNLICSAVAFRAADLRKMFYNISLIKISYIGLILSFIFGGLCMLISPLPYFVGIILCAIILVFNIIAIVKASAAADVISKVDDKVKAQTFFIKSLAVDAETLMAKAKSDEAKAACKKVYEAIRYSDPMSNEQLRAVELQIADKFSELEGAVAGESENLKAVAEELVILIDNRSRKCKLLK